MLVQPISVRSWGRARSAHFFLAPNMSSPPPAPPVLVHNCRSRRRPVPAKPRLFSCDVCGDSFTSDGHKQRHVRLMHDDTLVLHCPYPMCTLTFMAPSGLTQHKKRVHGEKSTHACPLPLCDASYIVISAVDRHCNAVHRGWSYACPIAGCGEQFATYRACRYHCITCNVSGDDASTTSSPSS
jgi:hypothetical protein